MARKISWADLMILGGNVALESMGFKTFGFARRSRRRLGTGPGRLVGRRSRMAGRRRRYAAIADGSSQIHLRAVQTRLSYVNPEGPEGKPDPREGRADIRETFRRMAMNDEETVALIAGGHTFGKTHGAHARVPSRQRTRRRPPSKSRVSAGPAAYATGIDGRRHHQRPRSHMDHANRQSGSTTSSIAAREVRLGVDKEARQARTSGSPRAIRAQDTVPGRARRGETQASPTMLTTDLSLRMDPAYEKISRRFYEHPEQFADAFARAWFKLTHRDMGPKSAIPWSGRTRRMNSIWQNTVPSSRLCFGR